MAECVAWRGKIHCGTAVLVCWSDAAFGNQLAEGKCRLGYVTGLMYPSLNEPFRILQFTSKFTWKLARSSLGGGAYAFSEMIDHAPLPRERPDHFLDLSPVEIGFGDCDSLFARMKKRKAAAKKYSPRNSRGKRRSLESRELGNSRLLPGLGNPADAPTEVVSDMAPLRRLLVSGTVSLRIRRPLRGVSYKEGGRIATFRCASPPLPSPLDYVI